MDVGRINFSPRFENALSVLREEAINSKMWEEEYRKMEYRLEEQIQENERLSKLVEELLCKTACRKSKKK